MRNLKAIEFSVKMSSLEIAKLTGKRHDHVMRDIRKTLKELDIAEPTYGGSYKDSTGRSLPCFNLPQRETLILVSGYSTKLRARIIDRWQELEKSLLVEEGRKADRQAARLEAPELTAALQEARNQEGKETQGFHYSNEYNMINKIVLGVTSKEYAKEHGLKPSNSIRDIMRPVEMQAITELQRANTSLIDMGIDYQERKVMLGQLYDRKFKQAQIDEVLRIES